MKRFFSSKVFLGMVALLFFAGVSWLMMGTTDGRLTKSYYGMQELEGWLWRFWWLKKILIAAWDYSSSWSYFFWISAVAGSYPETGNVFDLEVLSWPLELIFGDPLYYNVKCLLVMALNGFCGYLLGQEIFCGTSDEQPKRTPALGHIAASAVCGLVMMLSPYCTSEIGNGRIRQAILFPLALYVMYLLRLWRRPTLGTACLTGFWGGFTTLTYLFYGMSIGLFTAFFLLWSSITGCYGRLNWKRLGLGIIAGVLVILVSIPSGAAYVSKLARGENLPEFIWQRDFPPLKTVTLNNSAEVRRQNDPLLNSLQRFHGDSLPWDYFFHTGRGRNIPLVFSVLFAAMFPLLWWRGVLTRRRLAVPRESELPDSANEATTGLTLSQSVPWLVGVIFFYMLTLGPYVQIDEAGNYLCLERGGVGTPYLFLFKYLPAFSRLFSPVRMSGLMIVCLGVCTAVALQCLFTFGRWRAWLRAVSVALILGGGLYAMHYCHALPVPMTSLNVPDYYYQLADYSDPCTIVEIPIRSGDYMQYYQLVHGKKLLFGWADGGIPPHFPECPLNDLTKVYLGLPENSFLKYLEELNVDPSSPADFDYNDYRTMVEDMNCQLIIVHERSCYELARGNGGAQYYDDMLESLELLFGKPIYTGEEHCFMGNLRLAVFQMSDLTWLRNKLKQPSTKNANIPSGHTASPSTQAVKAVDALRPANKKKYET